MKKKLNLFDLVAMGVGSIIGSGIFALLGIGIGMTGRSVSIALVIGCVLNLLLCVPAYFTSNLVDFKGGTYGIAKVLLGKRYSGLIGMILLISNFVIAVYCISIIDYAAELVPFVGDYSAAFSIVLLTLFFGVSLRGVKGMARFQGAIVVIMILSLLMFIGFGLRQVQPGYFSADGFFDGGASGMILATAVLMFASIGSSVLVNFFDVTENPKKNFPLAIFISGGIVAVIYFGVGVVASGVLPLSEVADQNLALVANHVLPQPLYIMFIVGGAILALASTLNNMLAFIKYPTMEVVKDGYLPKFFLKTNGDSYPWALMLFLYVIGLIPILTGLDIEQVVSVVMGPSYVIMAIMSFKVMGLPKRYPEAWAKSELRVSRPVLVILSVTSGLVNLFLGLILIANLSTVVLVGNLLFTIFSVIYVIHIDRKRNLGVKTEAYGSEEV